MVGLPNDWRGRNYALEPSAFVDFIAEHWHIKNELHHDGRKKVILREKVTENIIQKIVQIRKYYRFFSSIVGDMFWEYHCHFISIYDNKHI